MGRFSGTDMKKIGNSNGFSIHALDDTMYLMLPDGKPDRVIITSHGGHTLLSKTNVFKVPDKTELRFYSDDTYSVIDPGFNDFFTSVATPKETLGKGKDCFDYVLTKYQGRHGNKKETYKSINNIMNQDYKSSLNCMKISQDFAKKSKGNDKFGELSEKYGAKAKARELPAVLTIRNRWFKGTVTLSIAIDAIKKAAPSIETFDCLFCRSTLRGGSQTVKLRSRD